MLDVEVASKKKRISAIRRMIGLIIGLPLIVAFGLVQSGLYQPYRIISSSMYPTLQIGDSLLTQPPRNVVDWMNRIVIFPDPTRPDELLIKRVVAVAGDRLQFENGRLYRNDDKSPLTRSVILKRDRERWTLGIGEVFVLGDNYLDSFDSLNFGPIKVSSIKAVPFYRYWPIDRRGTIQ
jgi:signal peptidase I